MGVSACNLPQSSTSPKKTVWVEVSIVETTLQENHATPPSGTGSLPRTS